MQMSVDRATALRERFLEASDACPEPLNVHGWPDGLHVRLISAAEKESAAEYFSEHQGRESWLMAYVVALCLCDETGRPILDASNADDVESVRRKNAIALQAAFDACAHHNRLDESATEDAKKNSSRTGKNDSGSTSATTSSNALSQRPS